MPLACPKQFQRGAGLTVQVHLNAQSFLWELPLKYTTPHKIWAGEVDPMGLGWHAVPLFRSHKLWATMPLELEGDYDHVMCTPCVWYMTIHVGI